jgi:hypothetical protein
MDAETQSWEKAVNILKPPNARQRYQVYEERGYLSAAEGPGETGNSEQNSL